MNKIFKWLKSSNHYKHTICVFVLAILNLFLLRSLGVSLIGCFIGSLYTDAAVSVALEFKDKRWGGEFSYQDLMADGLGFILAVFTFLIIMG